MERNLYAPPAAPVADPIETRAERPMEVTWAVRLIWTSLAIGVMTQVWWYALRIPVTALIVSLIFRGIPYVIVVWITLRVERGHNWARILIAALFLIGIAYTLFNWRAYAPIFASKQSVTVLSTGARTLLDLGALCLLFMPRANRWFRPPRAATA